MNRIQLVECRADALLAADPDLASWEHRASRSRLYRVLRSIGHWAWLLTLGGYADSYRGIL